MEVPTDVNAEKVVELYPAEKAADLCYPTLLRSAPHLIKRVRDGEKGDAAHAEVAAADVAPTVVTEAVTREGVSEADEGGPVHEETRSQQPAEEPAPENGHPSSEPDDEEDNEVDPEAELAAKQRAASDEAFWSAAQQALHERERREKVGAFLKEHGFSGVNSRKGWIWSSTYALHCAAELADAQMVRLLLESQANRKQRDSSGRTARQVAKSLNMHNSHTEVVKALTKPARARRPAPEGPSDKACAGGRSVAECLVAEASRPPPAGPTARDACVQCDLGAPIKGVEFSPEGI